MIAQSFRYWLADKLSDGMVMRGFMARAHIDAANDALGEARADLWVANDNARQLNDDLTAAKSDMYRWQLEAHGFHDALRTIAAMETPKAAHAAKRMARVAQEAVKS